MSPHPTKLSTKRREQKPVIELSDIYEKIGALVNGVENLNKKHDESEQRITQRQDKFEQKLEKLHEDFTKMEMTWNKIGGGIFMLGAVFSFIGYSMHLILDYFKN